VVAITLIAIFSAPKIYSAWFGMQQDLVSINGNIEYLKNDLSAGEPVRWSGSMPLELSETTMGNFLGQIGQSQYGVQSVGANYGQLRYSSVPEGNFALWTTESPDILEKSAVSVLGEKNGSTFIKRINRVYLTRESNFGFIQNVSGMLKRIDHKLGSPLKDPTYCQQPIPSCYGEAFPNPDFNRQPWFVFQYGPFYIYELSDSKNIGTKSKAIQIYPFENLRYGSLLR
jgi:hypothetical protein